MKKTIFRLILPVVAVSALFALSSCTTPPDSGDGTTTGYYGPSTANLPDYTEQRRAEFRNNW
ncbi:MAG: hypothetical protein P1U68_16095 [Verrucomicrobiales bacterium]|nr:hypothetical protein [Verrucomicrobiales bacterium]